MNADSEAAIIINDLDSLVHRIEALQAHPGYTDAVVAVTKARKAMINTRSDIHQAVMRKRYDV